MVKKSTLLIGIVLLLAAGVGTYAALAVFAPKQATKTATDQRSQISDDVVAPSDDTSDSGKITMTRRDVAVKNIMSTIAANMTSYTANNRGAVIQTESQLSSFVASYLADVDLTDSVTGTPYQISLDGPGEGIIYYQPGYKCSDDGLTTVLGSSRQIALTTTLPSGTAYCIES